MACLAAFACYAVMLAVLDHGAEEVWGAWAAVGYGAAVILAWHSRGRAVALVIGLAGCLAAPVLLAPAGGPEMAAVSVVVRSAWLLVHHGVPYLPAGQLLSWQSYDPYLPAMAIFGLPRLAGLPGLAGDPRAWLTVVTAAVLAVAFAVARPCAWWRCGRCRRDTLLLAALALASPFIAMPLALGVTDPPVIALICLALACVARGNSRVLPDRFATGRPLPGWAVLAGLAVGAACAVKFTAWPAVPVIASMLAARDGAKAAVRFAAASVLSAVALTLATAPGIFAAPGTLFENTVEYPLGLTHQRTPAASPLPGHLLAYTGSAGHLAATVLLLAAGLAVVASLVWRPPRGARAAALRLAAGLTLMILLAPDARFGYVAYPAGLLGWLALTGQPVRLPRRLTGLFQRPATTG